MNFTSATLVLAFLSITASAGSLTTCGVRYGGPGVCDEWDDKHKFTGKEQLCQSEHPCKNDGNGCTMTSPKPGSGQTLHDLRAVCSWP
ncbi:hypothetical protein E2P81_ATG03956 [Venturia nashicola]|uniref:Uncharacterized protein n=1 Tax=Venturia nashicola TaxID=86259 RepID=A0A4Z1P6T7_9PEZI|nr:hypothetical protein E6O75_ATG04052 [Venturia nashicola]TLD37144.1 hypothetical protein E2P81_ATG03956 [Venturia nashicola]